MSIMNKGISTKMYS